MADQLTYLELSEDGGSSHKFYEVKVEGKKLSIRFGRIGDSGQLKVTDFPSADKALAEAQKKIAEKTKKGYAPAVQGVRKKRSITRREITSGTSSASQAPILWKFGTGDRAFGIFVDEARCWVGNESGRIYSLSHDGKVLDQFRLPEGVKCIVADDRWLYAGCDDGNVYDLGGKVPRKAYAIAEDVDIFWIDIKDAVLGVSDANGKLTAINHEDEGVWTRQSKGTHAWMVRCDEVGMYHGHAKGVTMYDWEDGSEIWSKPTNGHVMFGWQEESSIYACTSTGHVHRFSKKGDAGPVMKCDSAVFSCAAVDDGKYVFAGDNMSSIYCFNQKGERLWKLSTGCGSAFSMQFFKDRLYIVTTDGSLACIDASEAAIQAAQKGTLPKPITVKAPKPLATAQVGTVETTRSAGSGVIVECYEDGGGLRVRVVSPGYNKGWHVQFPKDIREAGSRYVVEGVRESSRGGFYRAYGDIKKLVS
ncbi:MAG: WGR domain-containing protein [Myxococcaceae bacterium]|nr:WGR domain-containing protein [Myxococcaceae bacterium]